MEANHYPFTRIFSRHVSLPSHKYLTASAAVKGLLTEWFAFLPHTEHPSCYVGVRLRSRQCGAAIEHLLCISERRITRTVSFRWAGGIVLLSSSKTGSIAVVLRVKNLPVSQQHELSSQRNFLTSEIAVCVLLSTSHPLHGTWKTACEQEVTLPGYERCWWKTR